MARTKAEIRAFLDSMVGSIPQHPAPYGAGSGQDLSGQCVTGVKVLMDFIGVPNPYAARGNATDVDNTLVRQGIANNSSGWLNICVNHDMGFIGGVHYGHIWVDLSGEANYETNGNRALHTTKNTRPISQAQQIVNLDNYVLPEGGDNQMIIQNADNWFGRCNKTMQQIRGRDCSRDEFVQFAVGNEFLHWVEAVEDNPEADAATQAQTVGQLAIKDNWQGQIYGLIDQVNALNSRPTPEQLAAAQKAATDLQAQVDAANKKADQAVADMQAATAKLGEVESQQAQDQATGNSFLRWLGKLFNSSK